MISLPHVPEQLRQNLLLLSGLSSRTGRSTFEKSSLTVLNFFASVPKQSFCRRSCGLARKVERQADVCDRTARNGCHACRILVRTGQARARCSGLRSRTHPGPEATGGRRCVPLRSTHPTQLPYVGCVERSETHRCPGGVGGHPAEPLLLTRIRELRRASW